MIEVLSLQEDGIGQPQFFALTLRYPNMGAGYNKTTVFGTEAYLRGVLRDGGKTQAEIDRLFANAHR